MLKKTKSLIPRNIDKAGLDIKIWKKRHGIFFIAKHLGSVLFVRRL